MPSLTDRPPTLAPARPRPTGNSVKAGVRFVSYDHFKHALADAEVSPAFRPFDRSRYRESDVRPCVRAKCRRRAASSPGSARA